METENYSLKNRLFHLAVFTSATLLLALIVFLPANQIDHYPTICLWTRLGLGPCPGCGMTRAVWHLLHGEFGVAYQFNHLVVIVAPILAGLYIQMGYQGFTGKRLDVSGFLRRKLTGEKRREQDKITGKF